MRREIKLGVPVIALSRTARYYRRVIADATTDYNNCPIHKLFSLARNNTSVTLTHPISSCYLPDESLYFPALIGRKPANAACSRRKNEENRTVAPAVHDGRGGDDKGRPSKARSSVARREGNA